MKSLLNIADLFASHVKKISTACVFRICKVWQFLHTYEKHMVLILNILPGPTHLRIYTRLSFIFLSSFTAEKLIQINFTNFSYIWWLGGGSFSQMLQINEEKRNTTLPSSDNWIFAFTVQGYLGNDGMTMHCYSDYHLCRVGHSNGTCSCLC